MSPRWLLRPALRQRLPLRQWAGCEALFPQLAPQVYSWGSPPGQVPSAPRGVSLGSQYVGERYINCSLLTAWVCSEWFARSFTRGQWGQWQRYAGVEASTRFGVGVAEAWGIGAVHSGPPVDGVYLVDYTRADGTGHSILVIDYDPATDCVLTLEANSVLGLNGAGWRGLGNLKSNTPSAGWFEEGWAPKWSSIAVHATNGGHVAICRLRVDYKGVRSWLAA